MSKNLKLSSLDIVSSTYAGELALPYVAAAILGADSIRNNFVLTRQNVKHRLVLKKLDGFTVQPFGCDWTLPEDPSMELTEISLVPTELMVNEEICKQQFRHDWQALATGNGFINDRIPEDFNNFLLGYAAGKVNETIERTLWRGLYNETDGTTVGGQAESHFAGIMRNVVLQAANLGYDGQVAGTFTADNNGTTGILTHLDALVANAPDTIQNMTNSAIYMSRKSLFLLQRAMAGVAVTSGGYSATFVGDPRPTNFLGFPIVTPAGFPNDTIILSYRDNYNFGTDLSNDFNQVLVIDRTPIAGDDNVRLSMRFTAGTQIVAPEDIAVIRRTS